MRKLVLTAAASAAITAALSLVPIGAQAMTAGSASGVRAAMAETSPTESVAYVCRRDYGGRRCYRTRGYSGYYGGGYDPGYYGSGYYGSGYYGGYPGYYGGYGPGIGVYGPGFGVGIGVGPRWGW